MGWLILGAVARAFCEIIVVRLNIGSQVDNISGGEFLNAVQNDLDAVVVSALIMIGETNLANELTTFGFISRGNFIFRENCLVRALRDASAAINACVRIDIIPRPFTLWFSWKDAFYRANLYTTRVA
jgi:hypothetical protein